MIIFKWFEAVNSSLANIVFKLRYCNLVIDLTILVIRSLCTNWPHNELDVGERDIIPHFRITRKRCTVSSKLRGYKL